MSIDLVYALSGCGVTFLIGYGMTRAKVAECERRVGDLEESSRQALRDVSGLREVYVSQQHFSEMMETFKESQRDLNQKMERVLQLLTSRPA